MLAPISQLKKADINWLANHRCRHGHRYIEHYNCYIEENPRDERVGFFDIETSNLNADFGVILCYCIKPSNSKKILERVITRRELNTCLDKKVVEQCVKDLSRFDRIVTYYGKRFDIPYVRARALHLGVKFFAYGELIHEDLYDTVKHKFKIHSKRLENACRFLLRKTNKTHVDQNHWLGGLMGKKKSLDYIVKHCRYDVVDLERLYNAVYMFRRKTNTSV